MGRVGEYGTVNLNAWQQIFGSSCREKNPQT